jgi:hypothetical protein
MADSPSNSFYDSLVAAIDSGDIDETLLTLARLPTDSKRLDLLRRIAEDLDAGFDLEATYLLAEALNHAYVLTLDITYPLVRDLALANVPDRRDALIRARSLAQAFCDTLADTPELTPTYNRVVFLIRALGRMLGVG